MIHGHRSQFGNPTVVYAAQRQQLRTLGALELAGAKESTKRFQGSGGYEYIVYFSGRKPYKVEIAKSPNSRGIGTEITPSSNPKAFNAILAELNKCPPGKAGKDCRKLRKKGAVKVTPELVNTAITAAGDITVAALGGKKTGRRKAAPATEEVTAPPVESGATFPSWAPWAVLGGVVLLAVASGLGRKGGGRAAAPVQPMLTSPYRQAA